MSLRWTMESAWAAIAVVISAVGGIGTTVYHYGQTTAQIEAVEAKQADTDRHVKTHDVALSGLKEQNARIEQKLDDVADTVHDIRSHQDKRDR